MRTLLPVLVSTLAVLSEESHLKVIFWLGHGDASGQPPESVGESRSGADEGRGYNPGRETPSPGIWWSQEQQAGENVPSSYMLKTLLVDFVMAALSDQDPSSTPGILGKLATGSSLVQPLNQLQSQR